jgi:hypothetical protein
MSSTIKFAQRLGLTSGFVLLSMLSPKAGFAEQCNSPEKCQALYEQAIIDASTYEPSEIQELEPIKADRVNVVTLVSDEVSKKIVKDGKLNMNAWVTVVPRLKERCKTFTGDGKQRELRITQLLGLPPYNEYKYVVEMEVAADYIFRPCPDPDPSKTRCGQSLPAKFPENIKNEFNVDWLKWFAKTVLGSYKLPNGYPWTRLGYTYDWNPDSTEVGLTEYIILEGATVNKIEEEKYFRLYTLSDYCEF